MKTPRFLILVGFAAGTIVLIWQARAIREIRAEVASLRRDLRISVEATLDRPAGPLSQADQERRKELELIKLRHQVREMNEEAVESHARERMANAKAVMRSLLPARPARDSWNLRAEWKGMESHATNQYAQAMKALDGATNDYMRFLKLCAASKASLAVGRTEDARRFATDMLVLDDKFSRGDPEKANGDAVYNCHLVLGRIALDEGKTDEAIRHLLASGRSNGSPVLGSFGPNMSLDKDLLDKGEQEAVLQHLELCRKFWRSDRGKLDEWTKDIQAGRIPNFGANLIY